jgi:hypothetical protein
VQHVTNHTHLFHHVQIYVQRPNHIANKWCFEVF